MEQLSQHTKEEETLLKNKQATVDEIDEIEEKKKLALEELEKADQGFERVYQRVKETLEENKYEYEKEIKTLQGLIRKITDYTAKIQAQELRNKQLMELFLQQKKQDIRTFYNNHNTTTQYTMHLANRESGQSYFFDKKK